MDNVLTFWMRSFAVMMFVLALSVTVSMVAKTEECTDAMEKILEHDDVLKKVPVDMVF